MEIVILVLAALVVFLYIDEHREEKRDRELIKLVQNYELGEGVTLYEGILAYFGEEGIWLASSDCVRVFAGDPGAAFRIERLSADGGPDRFEIYVLPPSEDRSRSELDQEELEAFLHTLIEAAKGRGPVQ